MPLLLIPIFLFVIGLVIVAILAILFGLIRFVLGPILLVGLVIWLIHRFGNDSSHHEHRDRQASRRTTSQRVRKTAKNVKESDDDDWSDF